MRSISIVVVPLSLTLATACLPGEAAERIDALESYDDASLVDVTALQERLAAAESAIDRLEGLDPENQITRIEALEAGAVQMQGWADEVDVDRASHSSSITSHDDLLQAHATTLLAHDASLTDLATSIADEQAAREAAQMLASDELAALDAAYMAADTTLAGDVAAVGARADGLDALVAALAGRMTAVEDDITGLDSRVEGAEDDIDDLMVYAKETSMTVRRNEAVSSGKASTSRVLTVTKELSASKLVVRYQDTARSYASDAICGLDVRVGSTVCATQWIVRDTFYNSFTLEAECPGSIKAGTHTVRVYANSQTKTACYVGWHGYGSSAQLSVREVQ